mmetsp:Transcript_46581/g.115981  ORF Transcript_46581/g.115981 Transcript_46581/m.115981 type:complete len:204 (+) Transcript_46581:173-784(+)
MQSVRVYASIDVCICMCGYSRTHTRQTDRQIAVQQAGTEEKRRQREGGSNTIRSGIHPSIGSLMKNTDRQSVCVHVYHICVVSVRTRMCVYIRYICSHVHVHVHVMVTHVHVHVHVHVRREGESRKESQRERERQVQVDRQTERERGSARHFCRPSINERARNEHVVKPGTTVIKSRINHHPLPSPFSRVLRLRSKGNMHGMD